MTVSTYLKPTCFLCIPDERATASAITKTLPVAAPGTAAEANLELEVLPAAANVTDQNGISPVRLIASGTPSSSSLSLSVATARFGTPDQTGTYTITDTGERIGQVGLDVFTGAESIFAIDSASGYREPRGVARPNGNIVVVAERWEGTDAVVSFVRTASTGAWTSAGTIWTSSTAFTATVHPAPEIWIEASAEADILKCASWEVTDTNQITLRIDYSTDGGVTWAAGGYSNLRLSTLVTTYDRTRIAWDEVGQQLILLLHTSGNALLTYVSNNGGSVWTQLTSAASTLSSGRIADVWAYQGTQWLAYVNNGEAVMRIAKRAAGAGDWSSVTTSVANQADDDYLAAFCTPYGTFGVFSRSGASPGNILLLMSNDGGKSWGQPNNAYPPSDETGEVVLSDGAITSSLDFEGAAYIGGRVWLFGTPDTSATTTDFSLVACVFGERSNITPSFGTSTVEAYYPTDIPNTKDSGSFSLLTTSGASAESIVVSSDALRHRISNDNSTGYITVTGSTSASGSTLHWAMASTSTGGSTSTSAIVLRAKCVDGSGNIAEVEIRVDATNRQARLRDVSGAANLSGVITLPATGHLEFKLVVSVQSTKASAWYRAVSSATWTAIATNQTIATVGGGVSSNGYWGKMSASTAQVDTLWFWGIDKTSGLEDGVAATDILGIPAATGADRIPAGIHLSWQGSPLQGGASWTVRARSTTPLGFTSPFSPAPSPTRQWVSPAITAGSSVFFVYDFGASYRAKLSRNLVFVGWANAPGLANVRLYYWDGSALQTAVLGSTKGTAFTAGATGIQRDNVASYQFRPRASTSNTLPRLWAPDELTGWWAVLSDSVNTIAGLVLHNDPGQFTGATGALQASIELDPATVVAVAGSFGAFATNTTQGSLDLYSPDGIAVGIQGGDAVRHYAVEVTLAPGATVPKAGLLPFGAVYPFAIPARAGASMRFLSPDELRELPGAGLLQGRRVGRKQRRVVEMPFDQVAVPTGTFNLTGATVQNTLSFDGSTARGTVHNNLSILTAVHAAMGRRCPIGLVIDGEWSADPGSSAQSFVGGDVLFGYLENSIDITAGRGSLRSKRAATGTQLGGSLIVTEII